MSRKQTTRLAPHSQSVNGADRIQPEVGICPSPGTGVCLSAEPCVCTTWTYRVCDLCVYLTHLCAYLHTNTCNISVQNVHNTNIRTNETQAFMYRYMSIMCLFTSVLITITHTHTHTHTVSL